MPATPRAAQDDLFCTGTPAQWQYYSHMRWLAGWPMELDTFKCQLKPLTRMDYVPLDFTDEEWAKLNQAFPTGVCDFSKPAVAHQPTIPWITFADGPGGRPLGDPPTSPRAVHDSSRSWKVAACAVASMRARAWPPRPRV